MTIRLACLETGRTAQRDWVDEQIVDKREYDELFDELGGDPTGDVVLLEQTREGSESTAPRRWKVHTK